MAKRFETFEQAGIQIYGKRGQIKTRCPQCSANRKHPRDPCLSVDIERGLWKCHNCDWRGGLGEGSGLDKWQIYATNFKKRDTVPADNNQAIAWLKTRGIGSAVAEKAGVSTGSMRIDGEDIYTVDFPYFRAGTLVNVKHRGLERKEFRLERGGELCLYGLDFIDDEIVVITEGEIDCLSVREAGINSAVSVPNGAPSGAAARLDYLDADMDRLEKIKKIVIAVDADPPGLRLGQELARRFGEDRCFVASWPEGRKDANEVLMRDGSKVLAECLIRATPIPVSGVFTAAEFREPLLNYYHNGESALCSTGWLDLDEYYRVRPGELVIVTGVPSSGKSNFLDALMLNLSQLYCWRFGAFSPENYPVERHIAGLMAKLSLKPFHRGYSERMGEADIERGFVALEKEIFWLCPEDKEPATFDWILARAKSLVRRHGINGLLIDPWNEIEHERPQYQTEAEYVNNCLRKIKRFARDHQVAVWIAAHPTKLRKNEREEYPIPDPYDINGGAAWRNKADVCMAVVRDFRNEGSGLVTIHIQKVRFRDTGKLGEVTLVYNKLSGNYHGAVSS